jgi:chloramphenicol 3-O-phosphotransferase
LDLLEAAANSDLPYFLTTACYHVGDEGIIADWQSVMDIHGATFLPVHLVCTPNVQAERVLRPDRSARGKLDTINGLEGYMAKNDYAPLPYDNCLKIDTSDLQPQEVANLIISQFDLTLLPA